MEKTEQLDATFHFIMETFLARGTAPHFTEIAARFDVGPEEGKRFLHELVATNVVPMWLYPGTDLLVSFAPFNNLPTQYRITVDGVRKWSAQ